MRTPVLLVGMAVAILGYALVYNGMANLGDAHFGGSPGQPPAVGFIDSLIPHRGSATKGSAAPAPVPVPRQPRPTVAGSHQQAAA